MKRGRTQREVDLEASLFQDTIFPTIQEEEELHESYPTNTLEHTTSTTATVTTNAWLDDDDDGENIDDDDADNENDISNTKQATKTKQLVDLNAVNRLKKLKKNDKNKVTLSEYSNLLEERFKQQRVLEWTKTTAQLTASDGENTNLLVNTELLLKKSSKLLPPNMIEVRRLVDGNVTSPSQGTISGIHFHENDHSLITTDSNKHVKLFQLDNQQVHTCQLDVQFKDCRILSSILINSDELILCGRQPYFYSYNLLSGNINKYTGLGLTYNIKSHEIVNTSTNSEFFSIVGSGGYVHILSSRLKTEVSTLKQNSLVKCVTWLNDHTLATSGVDADVYIWDTRKSSKCVARFHNEDGTCTTALTATSENILAVGSESGVVALYDVKSVSNGESSTHPKPLKSILNLTTPLTHMSFHPSSQLLSIATNQMKDALKLIHMPSNTVYSNWPTLKTPLKTVSTVAYNHRGSMLAIGNNKGKVLLYTLEHFNQQQM